MRKTFFPTAVRAVSSVLVLSALAFSGAHAAGLGKLTVLSSLGQPLKAEIELTSVSKDDAGSIGAKLASMDAFRKANISYNPALSSLRFSIETRGERHVVRISSAQPMNEPFVDMLLELKSSSGHLVREYTFLLDPAELRAASAQVVTPAAVPALGADAAQPAARKAVPAAAEEKTAPVAKARPVKQAKPVEEAKEPKEEKGAAQHRVKKGETLAGIAKQNIHEDVSLEQMLVAIYRANPDAFAGNNMNRLKVGKVLSIPDAEDAGSVGKSEARKIIVAQSSDFSSYRNRLAGAAAQAAPQKVAEAGQVGGGQIGAKVEDRPTATTEAKDKLRVAKADAAKGDKATGVASAEDKLAKDKAATEAQARIKELEKNISDLQGVLQMKNKDMAAQQKQAETPSASVPAASAAQASAPAAAAAASAPAASTAASVAASAAVKPSAPKKKAVPPPPPPEEPGFFDELLDNPLMLGGLGAVILLLAYVFIRRRKKPKAEPVQPQAVAELPEEGKESSNSLFGASGGHSVDTNNSIFNSSFTPSASLLDTNEVDPIAEADVYIAYGREAQAIEILKEALRNHPERNALRIKLLEVYAAKKDLQAFDLLASELYSLTKGEGEEWVYAAGLGVSIDPGNPLYAGGDLSEELLARPTSLQSSVTRPSEELDPDILLATSRKQEAEEQHAESAGLQIQQEQLLHPDLPLDLEPAEAANVEVPPVVAAAAFEPAATPVEPSSEPAALNFDLGLSADFGKVEAPKLAEAVREEAEAGLDFVLHEPVAKPAVLAPEPSPEPEKKPALDALDFDLGDLDFGQAKQTKVEEASAAGLEVKEIAAEDDLDYLIEFKLQQPAALAEDTPGIELVQDDLHMPAGESTKMGEALEARSVVEQPALATHEPTAPAFDFGAINLDLEPMHATPAAEAATPASSAAGNVEMETKLDLADAYLGIGDKEGARELLEEVIQEGSGEQVERAKATLAKIS